MTKMTTTARAFALGLLALTACSDDPCDPDAPGTICTVVGSGKQGLAGDGGPATAAKLYVPQDTAISPDGELWVLDFNNYQVRAVDKDGIIRTVIGTGLLGDSPSGNETRTPALQASFNHTTDLLFHDGYLYLAAWHGSRIKRVNLSDMMLENYAGAGTRTHYWGDGGPALEAALDLPSSIAIDPNGNLVVMDQANQVIRRVDESGMIDRIAGTCVVEDFSCNGGAPSACPSLVDATGTTRESNKSACYDPALTTLEVECGKPCTPAFGGDAAAAIDLRMSQPYGQAADPAGRIAYDTLGNLMFADTDNNRIRRIDTNGIVTTIAGTGEAGYSGDGGPGHLAQINRPIDVEAGADGSIYFTDTYNSCIRKIDPAGIITTVVGQCSADPLDRGFAGDGGAPTDAKLDRPYGIDLVGNKLYVSDSYNNRVRVVNL